MCLNNLTLQKTSTATCWRLLIRLAPWTKLWNDLLTARDPRRSKNAMNCPTQAQIQTMRQTIRMYTVLHQVVCVLRSLSMPVVIERQLILVKNSVECTSNSISTRKHFEAVTVCVSRRINCTNERMFHHFFKNLKKDRATSCFPAKIVRFSVIVRNEGCKM